MTHLIWKNCQSSQLCLVNFSEKYLGISRMIIRFGSSVSNLNKPLSINMLLLPRWKCSVLKCIENALALQIPLVYLKALYLQMK